MKSIFTVVLLLSILSSCIQDSNTPAPTPKYYDLIAKVVYLKDGDSFVVLKDKKEVEIRLVDIDAPELHQPHGKKAKQFLSDLIKNKTIGLLFEKKDKYGRILADAYLDSVFVNLAMIKAGYAWHFTRFSTDKDLQDAEIEAREKKLGLWQDEEPIEPWYWRNSH